MAKSVLPFDTVQYEKNITSSFIYEPVFNSDGSLKDFQIAYASDVFARDWNAVYHNDDYIGAGLKESTLMDDYSLEMFEKFITEEPYPFLSYLPLVDMHLYFEPIKGLPKPYGGFYIKDITGFAAKDAKDHFLKNVRKMNNNAVLLRQHEGGHLEPFYISEEFAQMMECSVSEARDMLEGASFFKAILPEDRPLVKSMLKHRVAYDGSSVLTVQQLTAKKNRIWCNVHYAFIDDFNEHFIYCTYTDVTALKNHEERLKSVYANMGNNFYHVGEKTLAVFRVNLSRDSFEEIKGQDLFETDAAIYSYSECMRLRSDNFPITMEKAQFLKLFNRDRLLDAYAEGQTSASQILFSIRKDGHACFVNISANITRHPVNGDIIGFFTEHECNSEKVRGVLMSKILAERFDMVAYIVDGNYGVTIGEAAKVKHGSIFPITQKGVYWQYLENQVIPVLSGSDEQKIEMAKALSIENVEKELKVKEPYEVNIAIEMDGEIFYKQFSFFSVDREARFYILLKSDTTEVQKEHIALNEQLKTALDAANQANEAKTAFLSSMSHEIRTPMNAIIGLNNIALNDPELPDRTREYLEKIGGSARHLLGLINDILDMSRIESGRMTLRNEEFSFSAMLEQINTMINSQCQDRGLTYVCRIIGQVDDFYIGDAMKLKQVIINILGNAVKFTPAPGTITFIVERTAQFEGLSTLKFIMCDTGIGMDPSYLPKIFDAFSQENENKANKYGSTGLGMAITKSIVEMMSGDITVTSEKGVGSEFTVNVTLRNSDRTNEYSSDISPQDLRTLVIDDDPIACEHAKLVLEEIGISADTCLSGKEAIELISLHHARREAYNLIFVDWKMPEQDGVEVTREIRKLVGDTSTVIFLTAYNWDEIEEEALKAGVDDFMSKPLFASQVLSAFEQAMRKKHTDTSEEVVKVDLTGRRILLAEDMIINAEIMKMTLSMKEIEVDHAENGKEALDLFVEKPEHYYDAILMDMRMPVMNGLEATEAIRATDKGDSKTIPIIALTANAFDEDVQHSLQAGMNAHLSKPVESEKLFDTLSSLIKENRYES